MNQEQTKPSVEMLTAAMRYYAELHPRPSLLTKQQAAEMLGVCADTLNKIIRAGKVKVMATGRIHVSEIDRVIQGG